MARSRTRCSNLYERDYIREWDGVLQDVKVRSTADSRALTELLAALSSPASPLKGYLAAVAKNTDLLKPADAAAIDQSGGKVAAAVSAKAAQLASVLGAPPPGADEPGTAVSKHFEPIRTLMQGPPGGAPIDAPARLALPRRTSSCSRLAAALAMSNALDAMVKSGQADALQSLQQQAKQLPAPVGAMVVADRRAQRNAGGRASAGRARRAATKSRWRASAVSSSRVGIPSRAPAPTMCRSPTSARVFGTGGVFDSFFAANLAALVDVSRSPWSWREGAASIGGSAALLRQFQQARRIRDVYFKPGGPVSGSAIHADARFAGCGRHPLRARSRRTVVRVSARAAAERRDHVARGSSGVGQAAVVFEERGGSGPSFAKQGPWAWFRAFGSGAAQARSETRTQVTFAAGAHSMRLVLDAASVRNPFARDELAGFRCGM